MADQPVALVTGASKGIGLGLVQYFLAKGYLVGGCSRSESKFESIGYHHALVDVSDEVAVTAWVRETRRRWKRIDALICNAAYAPASQLLPMTGTLMWDRVMRTNVNGAFFACREVAKAMIVQRHGRIVTLTSMAAALHIEGAGAYASSKAAITEMTKVLARELASSGITCNIVGVSMVKTDMSDALGEIVVTRALEKLTLKRAIEVEEVCEVVGFLCSSASRSVTGQIIQMSLVT